MPSLLSFLFRAIVIVAGTVLALSLTVMFLLLLALWALRAGWARLTGRRATPFVMRMDPCSGFQAFFRRSRNQPAWAAATAAPRSLRRAGDDITDVVPK